LFTLIDLGEGSFLLTPGDALAWVREQLQHGTYSRPSSSKGM